MIADVSLVPLRMGEFTVYVSLPEPWPGVVAAAREAGAVDVSGYYRLGPAAWVPFPASAARPGHPKTQAPVTGQRQSSSLAWSGALWQRWPWLPGRDPFLLMTHSYQDQICLVVGGLAGSVTDRVLGSWLRQLPGLSIIRRSPEHPLVMLTCTEKATRQVLADQLGRLVWFSQGTTVLGARPGHRAGRGAGGRVFFGVHGAGGGRGGRFRSVYPQGPAGDRVRWAYRRRYASRAVDWLVERSAVAGSVVPAGLRPYLFGGGRLHGLSYFDRRDRASRAAVLGSWALGSGYVAWTPNHAYQPGTPAGTGPATGAARAAARPWHSQDLGELPFNADEVAVVTGYFADGRFAVYDERRDISYWETPLAFGLRLRKDLADAAASRPGWGGLPPRVVLLTDFDAVPAAARADVARGLGGPELITVNAVDPVPRPGPGTRRSPGAHRRAARKRRRYRARVDIHELCRCVHQTIPGPGTPHTPDQARRYRAAAPGPISRADDPAAAACRYRAQRRSRARRWRGYGAGAAIGVPAALPGGVPDPGVRVLAGAF